jgi:hypothetical protein
MGERREVDDINARQPRRPHVPSKDGGSLAEASLSASESGINAVWPRRRQ